MLVTYHFPLADALFERHGLLALPAVDRDALEERILAAMMTYLAAVRPGAVLAVVPLAPPSGATPVFG